MKVDFSEQLRTLECVSCSITFAITETVEKQLRQSQRSFTCPNGHPQSYKGVLEIEALRKRIQALEAAIVDRDSRLSRRWNDMEGLNRTIRSLRGQITKLKKARGE